jgi:hypothetical protein
MLSSEPVLGVDVGNVIICAAGGVEDTSFLSGSEEEAMQTPSSQGCFEALARLCEAFEGRLWIVSKAGPRVAARTLRWFEATRFFEITGIDPRHVRFCRERREKREHCVELGVTHFVDDRVDVLKHLLGLVPALFLFGPDAPARAPAGMQGVTGWSKAERAILAAWSAGTARQGKRR